MKKKEGQDEKPAKKGAVRLFGREYKTNEMIVGILFILPTVAFLIFTFIIPVIDVVELSFTNFSMSAGTMKGVGLGNYKDLLEGFFTKEYWEDGFGQAMRNTVIYSLLKLTLDTGLALFFAVLLDKNVPLKKFLRSTFFAPVVVPMVASSLIWMWFYDPNVGPLNQILQFVGLPESKWLYSEKTAMLSILFFSLWKGIGYNIILFLAGLQNISDSYVEAAKLDGASEWQLFWRVKFPLLRPITSFVIMMGIINSFKVFAEFNVMTPDGGPLGSTKLVVSYIYELAFTRGRMGRASAAALILFVIIFVLTQIQSILNAKKTIDVD